MHESPSQLIVHAVFSMKDRRLFPYSEQIRIEISNQTEHHRRFSFQEELRELLKRRRVAFDERYLWE